MKNRSYAAVSLFAPLFALLVCLPARAQLGDPPTVPVDPLAAPSQQTDNPISQPLLSPGVLQLLQLDEQFAKDVREHGGKAFARWFAPDGVTLNNGKAPVLGQRAVAEQATWDPKVYQLTWTTEGAQMGPSNDMGFTWGHYDGHSKDKNGQPIVISGRYITVWRKMPDGKWKVAMDASANAAPPVGSCCTLPKP